MNKLKLISWPLIKLMNSHFIRGYVEPFFAFVFPIILLFLMGNGFYKKEDQNSVQLMSNLIIASWFITVVSIGMFSIPTTIMEFKKTTLIKRISVSQIDKKCFLFTTFFYYTFWCLVVSVWVPLWGGILIGTKEGLNWNVAFNSHYWVAFPFMLLAIMLCVSFGIATISIFSTFKSAMNFNNAIYFPISLLSGAFLPIELVNNSYSLTIASYFLPTKYVTTPLFSAWNNGINGLGGMNWHAYAFPIITILFIFLFGLISYKKFKWAR